jgi:phospholipase C
MPASSTNRFLRRRRGVAFLSAAVLAGAGMAVPVQAADPDAATDQLKTATPIKHVIVVIGENRTFDHVYGTYVPKSGDSILNLLSERIVRRSGSPGPNFAAGKQFTTSGQTSYFIGVSKKNKTPYTILPDPTPGRGA